MTHPIIDFLLKKCHHTIFSRGESYVHNVHYLTKEDDTYTAKVLGSSVYEVEIVDEEDGDFYVSCNCPYESTYCKHVVAVGLQINEGNFKEIEATDEDEDDDEELSPLDDIAPADFYDTIFAKADKKVQEDFLKQFFLQNESFRNQFFNYQLAVNLPIESAKTTAKTSAKTHLNGAVSIDEEIEEVRDALCDLELDYDTFHEENGHDEDEYRYHYYNNYDDDDDDDSEDYEKWVKGEINEALSDWAERTKVFLKNGKLEDALKMQLALYIGAKNLENIEDDSDVDTIFYDIVDEHEAALVEKIGEHVTHPNEAAAWLQLFVEQKMPKDEKGFFYNAHILLLQSFVNSPQLAATLKKNILASTQGEKGAAASVLLFVAELLEDEKYWEKIAKLNCDKSQEIMQSLLEFYYDDKKDMPLFHKYAKIATEKHADYFDKYLQEKLIFGIDETLYFTIWERRISSTNSIEDYQVLRQFWNDEQREFFIELQGEKVHSPHFYFKILEFENRIDNLLTYLQDTTALYNNRDSFFKGIEIAAPHNAEEAFKTIEKAVLYKETHQSMNRDGYNNTVSFLMAFNLINGMILEKQSVIRELKAKYVRRPAFIDELKKVEKKLVLL